MLRIVLFVVVGCLLLLLGREIDGFERNFKDVKRSALTISAASTRRIPDSGIDEEYFNRPGPWDDKDLNTLLEANKVWSHRVQEENPRFFDEIKRGHAPKILWIGCR